MVVIPDNILHFKLSIIDGIGGRKEDDNEDTMPEEAIKAVLVQDGTKLHLRFKNSSYLRFFSVGSNVFCPQCSDTF
jgi:hypothetical protein